MSCPIGAVSELEAMNASFAGLVPIHSDGTWADNAVLVLFFVLGMVSYVLFSGQRCDDDESFSVDESDVSTEINAKIVQWVDSGDLESCWCFLQSIGPSMPQATVALSTLAAAVSQKNVSRTDVDKAIDTAEAACCPELADAGLLAGSHLNDAAWIDQAMERLTAAGITLKPKHDCVLAHAYGRECRADLSVKLWCKRCATLGLDPGEGSRWDPPPLPKLYTATLHACAFCGDIDAAVKVARLAKWRAPSSKIGQTMLLRCCHQLIRNQDIDAALECSTILFKTIPTMDVCVQRLLIEAVAQSGNVVLADSLYKKYIACGGGLDPKLFAVLMRAHCVFGEVEQALSYWYAMREYGVPMSINAFNAILGGCLELGVPIFTDVLISDMEYVNVCPSSETYVLLIHAFSKCGNTGKLLSMFSHMLQEYDLEANASVYHIVVCILACSNQLDLAMDVFKKISQRDCRGSAQVYDVLIDHCISVGMIDRAVDLLGNAMQFDLPSTSVLHPRHVKKKVLSNLLALVGRRGQARKVGLPLIHCLQDRGVEVGQHLVDAIMSCAKQQEPVCELNARRADWNQWRNFHGKKNT